MGHHNQTVARPRDGRGWIQALSAAAVFLLVFGVASLYYYVAPLQLQPGSTFSAEIDNNQRSLSIALPDGGCRVTQPRLTAHPIPPTWQASFPGSGSRMTWLLIEALTGIRTSDDYDSAGRGFEKVVAVKTHYPVKNASRRFGELDETYFGRAILLLRNPLNAIPSHFNLQYEHQNHLHSHSTRGPNEEWLKYRDQKFLEQTQSYEKFVQYWMEKYTERRNLLLISYEDMTDQYLGPRGAKMISNFLGETEGVDPIATESIPCVWEAIVNYRSSIEETDAVGLEMNDMMMKEEVHISQNTRRLVGSTHIASLRKGPKVRPYTEENLRYVSAMLWRLVDKYGHDEDFGRIMASYIDVVSKTSPQD